MKLIFAILLFSILGVTMTGCHRDVVVVPMLVDVNSALKLSGDNRGELQKVLDYYREEKPEFIEIEGGGIFDLVTWWHIMPLRERRWTG